MTPRLLSFAALFVAASASAQVNINRDGGNVTLRGTLGGYKLNPDGSARYVLRGGSGGPATVTQKTADGTLQLTAQQELDVVLRKVGGQEVVVSAKATGSVRTVRESNDGTSTTLTGSQADYSRKGTEGVLDIAGPVKIVRTNPAKKQTMVATGDRGQAILLPDSKKDSLKTATLVGNVDVDVDQAPYKDPETGRNEAGGKYKAGGGRLVYDLTGSLPKVTLTENVRLEGLTPENGVNSTGIAKLVMSLNAKGELTEAEATGGPVETVVTPKKAGTR